jgi:cobalamin biosynthesis protein CobD/CbiB
MITEEYRQTVHRVHDKVRRPYQILYAGLVIVGALFAAIGIKNGMSGMAALGGLIAAAFLVSLAFTFRQKAHTDQVLDAADARGLEQAESSVCAARQIGLGRHRDFQNSAGFGFEDSNYP